MKTMYKAYQYNPRLEVISVVKATHKTIWYTIKKFTIGGDLVGKEVDDKFLTSERRETDWYKFFDTKKDAQEWLLLEIEARRIEAQEELNLANKIKNEILDMEV